MVAMKKIYFIILSLLPTFSIFAQSGKEVNLNVENNEIHSRFDTRKEKGFYNIMQVSLLFGNSQLTEMTSYYSPYYINSSPYVAPDPGYYHPFTRTAMTVTPSFTITNAVSYTHLTLAD